MNTREKIIKKLTQTFDPGMLKVIDDSAKHAGHQEAERSGGGHFTVLIVADDFKGRSLMARHRMIYGALKKEMAEDIHALAIEVFTLKEYQSRS